ncbi:hypothetical protein N9A94_08980 [Akkermansiaceae bacterium]|nr:hypothetical protein [Akkermansiaceae bacterium]
MKNLQVIRAIIAITISFPLFGQSKSDQDLWESKGPHVRIKRSDQDGSYVVFERTPDDQKLIKTTRDVNDVIKMRALYYRNKKGFLTLGRIFDGQGNQLWRVRYGYDKTTGLLVAEDMFDERVKFHFPDKVDAKGNLVEMPVRRIYYFYDADGNQSKAIALVPNKGAKAEDVFPGKKKKSELDHFQEDKGFDMKDSTRPDLNNPFEEEKKKDQEGQPQKGQ